MNAVEKDSEASSDVAIPAVASTPSTPSSLGENEKQIGSFRRRLWDTLNWKPPWTRWDPEQPPVFSMPMNVLFGFAGAFTVANLYYSHPILNILAKDFGVSYETVSQIPTLAQSGYAVGLFFLCPLGDLFKRRPFVLSLVWFTATLWIGLCLTNSFAAFSAITFITAISTVTPQLMLPLVGQLAPPERRATALSIVTAGNLLGILLARLLSGVVTEYLSWRIIYWIAFGLQYLILILLWLFMPDYPSANPDGLNYFKMLWSVWYMIWKHPVLLQACLIAVCTSAPFTSYWTTLTFLLSGDPYNYNSLVIGLWALIGIAGMVCCPVIARTVIDKVVPLFSVIMGETIYLVGLCIGTYTGLYSVAGPALEAFCIDMGVQVTQIANRSAIYAVEPTARNRINTAFMLFTFFGQITGTAAGNHLYARGGWIASGSLSVGLICCALLLCAARGPWEEGLVGWSGGWSVKKKDRKTADDLRNPDHPDHLTPFSLSTLPPAKMPKAAASRGKAAKDMKVTKGKKKDPNAPKRGLSAYMFFANEQREKLRAEQPNLKFGEVGKVLGERWKALTEAQKAPYEKKAAADKKRYEDEKAAYNA